MQSLYLVTCPKGLVTLLNNELKRLALTTFDTFDTGTFFRGSTEDMMRVNLRSRIGNCVYLCLWEEKILDFDRLFEFTKALPWQDFCNDSCHISIEVNSYVSQLSAPRSIQSIVHKAIAESVGCMFPDEGKERDVYVHFKSDLCRIFVNTSWERLYKRGWRKQVGVAPLKENIAAGLVLLSGWKFREPLVDRCCGTGTILIEAAMIAKNIAPWLQRSFAFQEFSCYDAQLFSDYHTSAKDAIYPSNDYRIIWTDIDQSIINIAKKNAETAWVADCINFIWKDVRDLIQESFERKTYIVSNPPYGKRLAPLDIHEVYQTFVDLAKKEHSEISIISSYEDFDNLTQKRWSRKEMRNGSELCYIRTS